MSNPIALPEIFQAAFEDFIIPSYETAPFSTIQNRAKVVRSLKAIAGVERIHVKGINLLQNEFGPNGERVWESSDKDSRIRFVGNWAVDSHSNGAYPLTPSTSDVSGFIEVTFYGTGLNMLARNTGGATNFVANIDGGSDTANFMPNMSGVLAGRNYGINIPLNVASGLTLGMHTIRIRKTDTISTLATHGFEVLNERTNLAVYSGTGISNGSSQGLSALTTSAFNTGVSGTRGARVVKYVQGGVVSQAVQEVDSTSKYITLADHTNEEVVRRINYREFGANRADDFSTLAGVLSARAFTLDDGTTTLVGSSVSAVVTSGVDSLNQNTSANITMTFIGTGIDIQVVSLSLVAVMGASIDGGSINNLSVVTSGNNIYKIVSGLPYGTHTVKITFPSYTSGAAGIVDFIVYQPKTPSIPAGALEIATYNLMASYVANAVAGVDTIATGVLRKLCSREFTYVGTYTAALAAGDIGGIQITSSTVGNYDEYTFFGTGVEIRVGGTSGGATTNTVSIDGSSNFSGNTASFYGAGVSFVAATGVVSMAINGGGGVSINGLVLGKHTIRITKTTGAFSFYNTALDIITPIHSQDTSLELGSTSLKSVTKYSPEKSVSNTEPDLSKAKAWVYYDGVNLQILASSNISAVLRIATGSYLIYFNKSFKRFNCVVANSSAAENVVYGETSTNRNSNVVQIDTRNAAGTQLDSYLNVVIFGELIDE